ncbi:surface antigen family protein [Anaplasma phagocytophilum str. ApNP]|uniref:Surface antigen family protein n=1 Tax=Anaplasma phagocytophilum str. ApNP TaxID=1359153 RepID=A0A0F3NGU4_ANAPH|nr:surface antigen family protein [Anaplasma phagocytophilum str. ApNP]
MMVNACYDLPSEGLGVVPYACVGLGVTSWALLMAYVAQYVLDPVCH